MTLTDFLPKDVSLTIAMALCAIAFVSGTARGFSGFGSALIIGPVYAIGVAFGASLFGRASETVFRRICYALIAIAVITGLPALDGVLR